MPSSPVPVPVPTSPVFPLSPSQYLTPVVPLYPSPSVSLYPSTSTSTAMSPSLLRSSSPSLVGLCVSGLVPVHLSLSLHVSALLFLSFCPSLFCLRSLPSTSPAHLCPFLFPSPPPPRVSLCPCLCLPLSFSSDSGARSSFAAGSVEGPGLALDEVSGRGESGDPGPDRG